jgi:hypothetical protein
MNSDRSNHTASTKIDGDCSRRRALTKLAGWSLGAFALARQASAQTPPAYADNAPEAADAPALTCGSVEDDSLRISFEYVDSSVYGAAQDCRNCEFWTAVEPGQNCGGCTLIAGPISPYGWCTAWAPAAGLVAPPANEEPAQAPPTE